MNINLLRYSSGEESTLGLLLVDGQWQCYTLEDEYRPEKVAGETRMPAGRYRITLRTEGGFHQRYGEKFSDIHKGMLWLRDVPGFEFVLLHIGNRDDDTEGCILVGDSANHNGIDVGFVGSSTACYRRVYPVIAGALERGEEVWIEVTDGVEVRACKELVWPQWWFVPTLGEDMQKVNQYQFFQFGQVLQPLRTIREGMKANHVLWPAYLAKTWLANFLEDQILPMEICKPSAKDLAEAIEALLEKADMGNPPESQGQEIDFNTNHNLQQSLVRFETVLSAELQELPTYFIAKIGAYATADLIDRAEIALDEDVKKKIPPGATRDFNQAGKCLALDLPTASAFHIMRCTERVLREWHKAEINPKPARRGWAACVKQLSAHKADKVTLGILDQIRDLHRNPVMHPDAFLTNAEAQRLFDIAKSAISAMAERM